MVNIRSLKIWRSSPLWMASGLAPIISTPCFSSTPVLCSAMAVLSAVWPPSVGSRTSLFGGLASARSAIAALLARTPTRRFLHFLLFADDDFLHAFRRDGLDVGAVGKLRVGHDGGRIGVDEDDAVAFLPEGLAGLRAGIIELARLADDDRAGADDEDAVNVGALGHLEIYDLRLPIYDFDSENGPAKRL